jgi:hypothetical protein
LLPEPAGQQAVAAEAGGLLVVEPVEGLRLRGLRGEIDRLRRVGLHLEREFVRPQPCIEFAVLAAALPVATIAGLEVVEREPLLGRADVRRRGEV